MNGRDSDSVSSSRAHLRLVSIDEIDPAQVLAAVPTLISSNFDALIAEAQAIEAWYGINAYSTFLKKADGVLTAIKRLLSAAS